MISDPEGTILVLFATFCRIGGCFLVLPGMSSLRVPMQIRLLMSVSISMAIMPLMWDTLYPAISNGTRITYIGLIASETLIGLTIGYIARFITLGLQFAGAAMSMAIGFNGAPGPAILEREPEGAITSLLSFSAILLLFIGDFHHMIIQTVIQSYDFMPMGKGFQFQSALVTITDALTATFFLTLRLASPFIAYGLIFNLSIGMVNKLAPQIPVYFISTPFILFGGLILLFFGASEFLSLFTDGFFQIFQAR